MICVPRAKLPLYTPGAIRLGSPNVILAISNDHKKTATSPGHYFQYQAEVGRYASRYQINLSEDTTVRLNEDILKDAYGRRQEDLPTTQCIFAYYMNSLSLATHRYPEGPAEQILWVIQQPHVDSPAGQYPGRANTVVVNNYKPGPQNVFLTPLLYNGSSLVPESLRDVFPELDQAGIQVHYAFPNTYTLDRVCPKTIDLAAEVRRARVGYCTGWVDQDGPISFFDLAQKKKLLTEYGDLQYTVLRVGTVDPTKTTGAGWSVEKMRLGEYDGTPGVFFLIKRCLLHVNHNGGIQELEVTQLAHFGTTLADARANTNLSLALDMMVRDMYLKQNYWDKHPNVAGKFASLNRYFPDQSKNLGKAISKQIIGITASERPTYEKMIADKAILDDSILKKIGFPKLLARTERGRTYRRTLVATQGKERVLCETKALVTQHQQRRAKILAQRTAAVANLVAMKAQIAAIEEDVKRWNSALEAESAKVIAVEADYNVLVEVSKKAQVNEAEILTELGITMLPNIKQIWLKQNWLIMDLQYKNKVTGAVVSIKTNDELSMNTNWFLHKITARTIRPNIIRVGARELDWETKYGKRVGGPYLFEVTCISPTEAPKIQLWPAERGTILAIAPEHRAENQTERWCKLHPHVATDTLYSSVPTYLEAIFANTRNVCPGEATTALYQSFQNEDLTLILMTLNSWVTNADPLDSWGQYYTWFPKPEEVPCLQHQFSFETKKLTYYSSTSKQNHLFYELSFTDGIGGLSVRFGSMVRQGSSWIIPTVGGRSVPVTCSAEEVEKEATTRINAILKKGYAVYKGNLINETASIEQAIVELAETTKDNNEIISA